MENFQLKFKHINEEMLEKMSDVNKDDKCITDLWENIRKNLVAVFPEAITLTDLEGSILCASSRTLEMHGYVTEEELLGQSIFVLIAPENHKKAQQYLERTFKEKIVREVEFTFVRKDGSHFPASLSAALIEDPEGKPQALIATTSDITERKKAEKALIESKEKFEHLYQSSFDGIAESDLDGNIISCNQTYLDMTGYSEKEIKELTYLDLTPPKWHQLDKKQIELCLKRGYSDLYEKERIRKDGTTFPITIRIWLRKDKQGNPLRLWGIVRDITEQKKAEEELRASEKKFKLLAEHSADVIYRMNIENEEYLYVSPSVKKVFGYTPQEALSLTIRDILTPESYKKQYEKMQKDISSGKISTRILQLEAIHKDGHIFPVEINATFIYDSQKKPREILGVARDITERKKAEDALKQKIEEQKVLLSSISAFVYFKDTKLKLVTANKAFADMVGIPQDQLVGKTANDLFPKKQADAFNEDDKKVIESGSPMFNIEEQFTDAEGKTRWASTSKVPYFDEDGNVIGMVGITIDITDHKRADEELKKARNELEKKVRERTKELEKKNIALKEILANISEEKMEIRREISSNVDQIIMPIVLKLKRTVAPGNLKMVELLENGLKELSSSSVNVLSAYSRLSPREIEICNMIKNGLTSKEISVELNIAITTVQKHRQKIRKKLGLTANKANLRSYLISLS